MNTTITQEPRSKLLDALGGLEAATRVLVQDLKQGFSGPAALLKDLEKAINALGLEPASNPRPRPEYIQQWHEFLAGQRQSLESRTVRYLCWESDIAIDDRFQDYLDQQGTNLSPRSLPGLVKACHNRWSSEFVGSPIAGRIRHRLESYDGLNRLLTLWRNNSQIILGQHGPELVASRMVENRQPIKAFIDAWKIEEQSAYFQEVVQQAARVCRDQMQSAPFLDQYLLKELLAWRGWLMQDFKREIGEIILSRVTAQEGFRENFKHFVLNDDRLRDPRLPWMAGNWIGVSDEARLQFIQWLSRDDIEFFFEHAFPSRQDPQRRKPFWLQYVKRVCVSRPLLNAKDRDRLQVTLHHADKKVGNFGYLNGVTSAFLLDFGPILVVEFSKAGNACYVYRKPSTGMIPDFWSMKPFSESKLKQPEICTERIIHKRGWQAEMRDVLARFGIRPG